MLIMVAVGLLSVSGRPAVSAPNQQPLQASGQESPVAIIPFSIVDGRILIETRLDGRGPFRMILDSGASAVLSQVVAERLRLSLSKPHLESGTGNKTFGVSVATIRAIQLGSSGLSDIDFDVMSMVDMPPVFGTVEIDGILGRPVFDRYTVQVDYDRHLLLLFTPGTFRPGSSDTPVPFTRVRDVPLVKASLDGHDGLFGVDLGARSSLLVNGWFAEVSHLIPLFQEGPDMITGWGFGGAIHGKLGRAQEFDLANAKIEQPVVRLSTQRSGLLSRTDTAGLIGADILRQFTLTFDPVRQVIYFRRSRSFGRRTEFDRSGMWVIQSFHAFTVIDIVGGGAAEGAGLEVNDSIRSIDGRSVSQIRLADLRDQWAKQPDGTRITLAIKRGNVKLKKILQLKSLV
jgi:Aspartyl protease/PDZ domain